MLKRFTAGVGAGVVYTVLFSVGSDPVAVAQADFNRNAPASCGTIVPKSNYGAGIDAPREVVVADVNSDGKRDVAVANRGANSVAILLGNGDGTLGPVVNYTVGSEPSALALADFNGDGRLDLAAANAASSSVSILTGVGDGSFTGRVDYGVGPMPLSIASADFNGDGRLDLATANNSGVPGHLNNVSILLGNGNGTFAAAVHYGDGGFEARSVKVGDFNHDSISDLVVANHALGQEGFSILVGNGDGTFQAPRIQYTSGLARPNMVSVNDVNGDGRLDLAIAGDFVPIYLGRGDATFQLAGNYPAQAESVAIVDVDMDGRPDLAITNGYTYQRGVSIRFGNGSGGFGEPVEYDTGWVASWIATGDVNGDGTQDLAVTSTSHSSVGILLNICAAADLTIDASHAGDFTQGQAAATYTITVGNAGTAATIGTVSVTATLSAGLTRKSITGSGWSCAVATLTCTRSDALGAGAQYPPITLTVTVRSNASASQSVTAATSGGGELDTTNNSDTDPTNVVAAGLVAPTSFVATAASTSAVSLTWDAVGGAMSYQVLRRTSTGSYEAIGSTTSTSFADTGVAAHVSYLYRVQAADGSGGLSPPSPTDLATTVVFTDDPLVAHSTTMQAVHIQELRASIDMVRAAAGLPPAAFTGAAAPGDLVRAIHVAELRPSLDEARAALGLPALDYTDPTLTAGVPIKAAHVQELRSGAT